MRRLASALLLLCLLQACGSSPQAPIEDRRARHSGPAPASYTVRTGDTLYGIAFTYGVDYRRLAAANGIAAPYIIYPGQTLLLRADAPAPAAPATSTPAAAKPGPVKPAPVTAPTTVTAKPAAPVTKPSSPRATTTGTAYAGGVVKSWRWPTQGRVTRRYSGSVHKGIDIGGERGDAIVAVAPGRVVYAGTGIVGFGELLIIKHNEQYLSAYGHNDRLLVGEGDTVAAGQRIADKGSSGTDTVKLHFEIRRDGKPIDPLGLLPGR